MAKNPKATSWGAVADWYDELLSDQDTFQAKVILPNLARLLAIKKGEKVLDLACGTGYFARAWKKQGAQVIGTDVAKELIEIAKKQGRGIAYALASADHLKMLADASIDKITCVLALQNIENIAGVMREVERVLKPGGRFYAVINHPAFRVPKASAWGWDSSGVQYRRVDKYLSVREEKIKMHPGDAPEVTTITFHRPLQFFFSCIAEGGLMVGRLEEWISHKASDSGPRAKAENVARKEIPMFMCLEILKHDPAAN
jgi:SAM-dependent methyltransferase